MSRYCDYCEVGDNCESSLSPCAQNTVHGGAPSTGLWLKVCISMPLHQEPSENPFASSGERPAAWPEYGPVLAAQRVVRPSPAHPLLSRQRPLRGSPLGTPAVTFSALRPAVQSESSSVGTSLSVETDFMDDLSLVAYEERMWQRQANMQRLLDLQAQEQTLAALQAEVTDRINEVVDMERRLEEQLSSNEEIKRRHLKRRERNSKRES